VRLPRDLSGRELAQALSQYGYAVTRETGSHVRLTTLQRGEHHVTIPITASSASARLQRSSPMSRRISAPSAKNSQGASSSGSARGRQNSHYRRLASWREGQTTSFSEKARRPKEKR
jgi:predicted RNA binding protein YcfA (HicA-like mRNA interferase family)